MNNTVNIVVKNFKTVVQNRIDLKKVIGRNNGKKPLDIFTPYVCKNFRGINNIRTRIIRNFITMVLNLNDPSHPNNVKDVRIRTVTRCK